MRHEFVEYIPEIIEENVLYISIEYNVAKHKCPCGCGEEIVTSLSPVGWKLIYDGENVSLSPSIGNWQHSCKSHYYIRNDNVVWAGRISNDEMKKVIDLDKAERMKHGSKSSFFVKLIRKIFDKKSK